MKYNQIVKFIHHLQVFLSIHLLTKVAWGAPFGVAFIHFISFIMTQHQDTQYNILNAQDIKESVCNKNYKSKHITKIEKH
jgi:hypothetical protein